MLVWIWCSLDRIRDYKKKFLCLHRMPAVLMELGKVPVLVLMLVLTGKVPIA